MAARARRAARRRGARRRWRRSSSCPAWGARRPTSCSAMRSACPACRWIATCCALPDRLGIAKGDDPEPSSRSCARSCRPTSGCWRPTASSCTAPHLPAEAAVPHLHGRGAAASSSSALGPGPRHGPRAGAHERDAGAGPRAAPGAARPETPATADVPPMDRDAVRAARRARPSRRFPPAIPPRDQERRRHRRGRASDEVLDEMGIEPPDTLFGLYQGTPLTERHWSHGNDEPDRITIYQGPIEDACDTDEDDRRDDRRNGHSRVRPLLRPQRGRDRRDRGTLLARRGGTTSESHVAASPSIFSSRHGSRKSSTPSAPGPDDAVLEIGPGRGALTRRWRPASGTSRRSRSIAISSASCTTPRSPNVRHRRRRRAAGGPRASRCAKRAPLRPRTRAHRRQPAVQRLVTDPVRGSSALAPAVPAVRDATMMLQREVADRVASEPGGGDWGPLGIAVQLHADVVRLLALPPGAFRPQPRVHSAIVRLRFRPPRVTVSIHVPVRQHDARGVRPAAQDAVERAPAVCHGAGTGCRPAAHRIAGRPPTPAGDPLDRGVRPPCERRRRRTRPIPGTCRARHVRPGRSDPEGIRCAGSLDGSGVGGSCYSPRWTCDLSSGRSQAPDATAAGAMPAIGSCAVRGARPASRRAPESTLRGSLPRRTGSFLRSAAPHGPDVHAGNGAFRTDARRTQRTRDDATCCLGIRRISRWRSCRWAACASSA